MSRESVCAWGSPSSGSPRALPLCPPMVSPVFTALPKHALKVSAILDDLILSQLPIFKPCIENRHGLRYWELGHQHDSSFSPWQCSKSLSTATVISPIPPRYQLNWFFDFFKRRERDRQTDRASTYIIWQASASFSSLHWGLWWGLSVWSSAPLPTEPSQQLGSLHFTPSRVQLCRGEN